MDQIAYARKEIAFNTWKMSGYRDREAYAEFLHWFNICQGIREDRSDVLDDYREECKADCDRTGRF